MYHPIFDPYGHGGHRLVGRWRQHLTGAKGKFRAARDNISTSCRSCPTGYWQENVGQPNCLPCFPGKYQPEENSTTCFDCPKGYFGQTTALRSCDRCPVGRHTSQNRSSRCHACPGGRYGQDCIQCSPGMYRYYDHDTSKCKAKKRRCQRPLVGLSSSTPSSGYFGPWYSRLVSEAAMNLGSFQFQHSLLELVSSLVEQYFTQDTETEFT